MTPQLPRHKISQGPMPAASASPPPLSLRPGRKTFIEHCERVRFRGDRRSRLTKGERLRARSSVDQERSRLLGHSLRVDRANAPEVFKLIDCCANRLGLATLPEVFVCDSDDLAYCCSAAPDDHALLQISGKLFDLLDDDELSCVICHELGHLALHGIGTKIGAQSSMTRVQYGAMSQAREISADRVGLMGCANFEASTRALVKVHCGFSRIASKIDVQALLSQAADIDARFNEWQAYDSHPFLPLRLWALAEFHEATSGMSIDHLGSPEGSRALAKVDESVARRLDMLGGGTAVIDRARDVSRAQVWLGTLWLSSLPDSAREQAEAHLRATCGDTDIQAAIRVLRDCGDDEILIRARTTSSAVIATHPGGGKDLMHFIDTLSAKCGVNVKTTEAWVQLDELIESATDDSE